MWGREGSAGVLEGGESYVRRHDQGRKGPEEAM